MMFRYNFRACHWLATWLVISSGIATNCLAGSDMPLGGFIPFVGMALTNQYATIDTSATFFIAEPASSPGGSFLGPGTSGTHYELALFDSGAATHIITSSAYSPSGFNIAGRGFSGTNFQVVGGATGQISLEITDPLGVYAAGLSHRTGAGTQLTMNNASLRGQTSFSILAAPSHWTLPNIIGLPMVAQHMVSIRNDQPQIFPHQGRTVRTPNVLFGELGTGSSQGITRRLQMNIRPGINFVQGPIYTFGIDIFNPTFHDNPLSPSVIPNGGLFVDVDVFNDGQSLNDTEFLFDTGADLTVVSQQTAVRLGFDPILDTPDFILPVEGSGGISTGVPGFYLDRLRLDTVGGGFEVTNVPVAVLDVTNPNDPGNIIAGILGTNVFAGRNLVIDAIPQIGQGGAGPSLYISNPVTQLRTWGTTAASASWVNSSSWTAPGVPDQLWDAQVANIRGSAQEALLSTASTVFRATISGGPSAEMTVNIATGGVLTTYQEILIKEGGRLHLSGGSVDSQLIQLDGGSLTGGGSIFVGNGPLSGSVRNEGGQVAPGVSAGNPIGVFNITGDFDNGNGGTLALDLGGTNTNQFDRIVVSRNAFLDGGLAVSLVNGFTPIIGSTFTILSAANGIFGQFDSLSLPAGYSWSVNYNPTNVVLQITGLGLPGDFNGDGELDCGDINEMVSAVVSGSTSSIYDVNNDGMVNVADVHYWITDIKQTILGDANLDGIVDGQDFITWNGNKFSQSAAWCLGDFNADGVIDGQDFITWNNHKFQAASNAHVPEPISVRFFMLLLGLLIGSGRRKESAV